ncbi:galactokinase [Agromyces seonyuensis]|uniref:Galactokinase n=1 Tax=Agromyces seonyuensis TaxID=2662446 RepID=A0A6I4NYL0_9MICO|nr:galactokinase [Agromyces seonyuensis]MWB99396.1 galactokinase [Agromyces seonyuensis]
MTVTDQGTAARFADLTGREPAGVWSAPGRVNLIGEHTDYNAGFVLPFAIDRRVAAAAGFRDDRVLRVATELDGQTLSAEASIDDLLADGGEAALEGWSAYPLGVAWSLLAVAAERGAEFVAGLRGIDLVLATEVPVGAGLSSSAAVEASTAVALDELWGLALGRELLARVCQRAENVAVGAPTGIMDQFASLFGAADAAVFLDCRSLDAAVVPLGLAEHGLEVLVVDTRVAHRHADGGYRSRREACEAGAAAMGVDTLRDLDVEDLERAAEVLDPVVFRRVRHVVTENRRVLDTVRTLREQGAPAIGPLLDASHVSMRDDFEISVPELDLAVETAQASGALGARMTGGGFGGSAIALVAADLVPAISAAVLAAFAEAGYAEPKVFTVHPADGAGRLV